MTLIHLLLISSLEWILYCMYVYILILFEKIFCFSYRRKIIDKHHFPSLYFNSPFRYFGSVPLMRLIHLLLISSLVWILYCYICLYIIFILENILLFISLQKLLTNSIFPIF